MNNYLTIVVGGIALLTGTTVPAAPLSNNNWSTDFLINPIATGGNGSDPVVSPEPTSLPVNGGTDGNKPDNRNGSVIGLLLSWVTYQITPSIPVSTANGSSFLQSDFNTQGGDITLPEPPRFALLTLGIRG